MTALSICGFTASRMMSAPAAASALAATAVTPWRSTSSRRRSSRGWLQTTAEASTRPRSSRPESIASAITPAPTMATREPCSVVSSMPAGRYRAAPRFALHTLGSRTVVAARAMIGGMPAAPEGHDQPPVRDAGQSPPPPADPYAPWVWTAYPPPGAVSPPPDGQPPAHPGTVYPPPGAVYPPPGAVHPPGTIYPPPDAAYRPGTMYPPPGAVYPPGTAYPPPGTNYPPGTVYPPPAAGYVPAGWGAQPAPPQANSRRRGGFVGGLLTALAAIAKLGYFGKFGFTALTMVIAVVAYSLVFGWAFAVGLVLIIFVHEMGHFLTSRVMGVPMSAPVFVPFLGAFTAAGKGLTSDRRREAVIAIAGPISGFVATLARLPLGAQPGGRQPGGALRLLPRLLRVLHHPLQPDPDPAPGRRSGHQRYQQVVQPRRAGLLGALVVSEVFGYSLANPILILIFVVAIYSVWGRFRAARMGAEAPPLPVRTRFLIGAGYVAMVAMSGLLHDPQRGLAQQPRADPELRSPALR